MLRREAYRALLLQSPFSMMARRWRSDRKNRRYLLSGHMRLWSLLVVMWNSTKKSTSSIHLIKENCQIQARSGGDLHPICAVLLRVPGHGNIRTDYRYSSAPLPNENQVRKDWSMLARYLSNQYLDWEYPCDRLVWLLSNHRSCSSYTVCVRKNRFSRLSRLAEPIDGVALCDRQHWESAPSSTVKLRQRARPIVTMQLTCLWEAVEISRYKSFQHRMIWWKNSIYSSDVRGTLLQQWIWSGNDSR